MSKGETATFSSTSLHWIQNNPSLQSSENGVYSYSTLFLEPRHSFS
jgi:hypothetical protein